MDRDWGGLRRRSLVIGEAADCDVSVADGVKEDGVGRGTK
jgi:hypothetical protein